MDWTQIRSTFLLIFVLFAPSFSDAMSLEWTLRGGIACPDTIRTRSVALVVNLTDDNSDGLVNEDDDPDVVNVTDRYLRAAHGADGSCIFEICDRDYWTMENAIPAVGDIDNDGFPEIVVMKFWMRGVTPDALLMAFEHDGSFKWESDPLTFEPKSNEAPPALADLTGDGTPEILVGGDVFNAAGNRLFSLPNVGRSASYTADLDLDGSPEIIAAGYTFRADGSLFWQVPIGAEHSAVANFDDDPYPEVAFFFRTELSLFNHDGSRAWGPVTVPSDSGQGGGPPVVADFDGDCEVEIGVASDHYYTVFNADGSVLWSVPAHDGSSFGIGSTAFDFDSDGAYDIAYQGDDDFYIFRGTNGDEMFHLGNPEGTAVMEYPTIADVDRDGRAEVLVPSTDGLKVYGDPAWPPAREIWNQHAYSVTNINDDATVPMVVGNHWESFNAFRTQAAPEGYVPPGVVGNTFYCTKSGDDVVQEWFPSTPAAQYMVAKDNEKTFLAPVLLFETVIPRERHVDAVPGPPQNEPLFYYRVVAEDCWGNAATY
ncbi:FG-GAP repeat domain-containing protein [Acidobacteriota bacterium]